MDSSQPNPAAVHQMMWILGGLLVGCLLITAWAIRTFLKRFREGKAEIEKMRQDARLMQLDQLPNVEDKSSGAAAPQEPG